MYKHLHHVHVYVYKHIHPSSFTNAPFIYIRTINSNIDFHLLVILSGMYVSLPTYMYMCTNMHTHIHSQSIPNHSYTNSYVNEWVYSYINSSFVLIYEWIEYVQVNIHMYVPVCVHVSFTHAHVWVYVCVCSRRCMCVHRYIRTRVWRRDFYSQKQNLLVRMIVNEWCVCERVHRYIRTRVWRREFYSHTCGSESMSVQVGQVGVYTWVYKCEYTLVSTIHMYICTYIHTWIYIYLNIQPIPLGVTFSKVQSLKI